MQHDVFICHASEDKDTIAGPLAEALRDQHVDVWYDDFSLKVGQSLREAIDQGLAGSRFGIVIISRAFFAKRWTQRELNGLVAREMGEGRKLVLPIWHEIELGDVLKYSPPLADIRALRSNLGIQHLCREILRTIQPTESSFLVAREELERFGWSTPSFSDEWWLDMVELMEQMQSLEFRAPWFFPLPESRATKERGRGLNIAWAVLQSDWQYEAEHEKVCQTTNPQSVLNFVRKNKALKGICEFYPETLANYAPQLLIPEFSEEYGSAFDKLLAESEAEMRGRPDSRYPNATCDRRLALRHPMFGGHTEIDITKAWLRGFGGSRSAMLHEFTDYVFWLLAKDSTWMPALVRNVLTTGMRDWAPWNVDLLHSDIWEPDLIKAIFRSRRPTTSMKWTRTLREQLAECASKTVRKLGLNDDPMRIATAFIEKDFVSRFDVLQRLQRKRNR